MPNPNYALIWRQQVRSAAIAAGSLIPMSTPKAILSDRLKLSLLDSPVGGGWLVTGEFPKDRVFDTVAER
jgi:hypothetical protein